MTLSILYQDDALIAVNKPHGIVIHHGLPQEEIVLVDLLREQVGGTLYPTHRLDRATSGAIVFGRSREATAAINASFSARRTTKEYLAIVSSNAPKADDTGRQRINLEILGTPASPRSAPTDEALGHAIDIPLSRSARGHKRSKEPLLPALTHYHCLHTTTDAALLQVSPHTGRQHQIRRHLKALGAPIWGDRRYGHKRLNRNMRIEISLHRMALHAYRLCLPHPITDAGMELIAPLPKDLAKPMQKMGFLLEQLGLIWEEE